MNAGRIPLYRFLAPRYWPTWAGIALLRALVALPQRLRMAAGRGLGRLARRLLSSRRRVVTRNLELCFPELGPARRADLERQHFESLGMGIVELGMAWWCADEELAALTELEGVGNVERALERGRGVLLLSGHFAAAEVCGRVAAPRLPPLAAMYRPSSNPFNDQIMRRCRQPSTPQLITKRGIKELLRVLRENRVVWYAADQADTRRGTVLAPFFGEPAMTNTAAAQIARISGAAVVPFQTLRLPGGRGYRAVFEAALENFPGDDAAADAARLNRVLEAQVRRAPEQYWWVHRRFKGRPAGYPDPYAAAPPASPAR